MSSEAACGLSPIGECSAITPFFLFYINAFALVQARVQRGSAQRSFSFESPALGLFYLLLRSTHYKHNTHQSTTSHPHIDLY